MPHGDQGWVASACPTSSSPTPARRRPRPSRSPRPCAALGYGVWRDDELPAHRAYAEVIEERLQPAKAVVVIWSAEAVKSRVGAVGGRPARADRQAGPAQRRRRPLPMPFDRIQCADLAGWTGDPDAPGWRKVVASVAELVGGGRPRERAPGRAAAQALDLRAAVRQHERRSRAGVFHRRDQRRHHHRPLQGLGARRWSRATPPSPSRARASSAAGRPPAGRQPRAGRQRAQGRQPGAHHRPADRRRAPATTSGPSATTAT